MTKKSKTTPAKDPEAPRKKMASPKPEPIEHQGDLKERDLEEKKEKAPQPFEDLAALTGARSTFTQDG